MKIVINETKAGQHSIDKYKFKVFSMGAESVSDHTVSLAEQQLEEPSVAELAEDVPGAVHKRNSAHDEMVESLLKKTDDVTSNFIKMQMKLEAMEESHKTLLEEAKKEAYNEGVTAGRSALESELSQAKEEGISQFSESVKTLEISAQTFERSLGGIQEELIHAAIDIAKEVIAVDVSEQGSEIAKKLSSSLIEELQSASKVTLKVNPADHGAISEHVGTLEHIDVISDSAISRGGVVAISDAGNIDSEIMKRFERVKRAALSD
ncbi:MAG: flagellar assembly protein FliH [Campylobacterota bacterium]|nr:flagellar assembly protein FliH [Campylobacterota bacterium]